MAQTLVSLWTQTRKRLEAAGVDTPVLDARMLIEAGAGVSRLDIVTDPYRVLSELQLDEVESLVLRRLAREPVAYIVGRKAFWKSEFVVTPDVLIPRAETEHVVEAGLSLLPPETLARVLDIGVGSGAILLALLSERPDASGVGADVSRAALDVARTNAIALGLSKRVTFVEGAWAEGADGRFDLVVSNPPYIASGAIAGLSPEVRQEPRLALDGGADGLEAYRAIAARLDALLTETGGFVFEVGLGQEGPVSVVLEGAGMRVDGITKDLAGRPRVLIGRRKR